MKIINTSIDGVLIIKPTVHSDDRGYFVETYHKEKLKDLGLDYNFVQDNQSLSLHAGTVRGLHYQLNPKPMTKLVKVLHGAIYDVAVDIRVGSPTYGQYVGAILTSQNQRQLLIPAGFAHGLCTLAPNTVVTYKIDQFYDSSLDRAFAWDDPDIGIDWSVSNPIVSQKDRNAPPLRKAINNFKFQKRDNT
tara:strand:+ start:7767 stop:8336 length:570 start_codon:yes stop_codon:yes gene_type:complete